MTKVLFIVQSALCVCVSHFSGTNTLFWWRATEATNRNSKRRHWKTAQKEKKTNATKQNRQRKAIEKSLLNKLSFQEILVQNECRDENEAKYIGIVLNKREAKQLKQKNHKKVVSSCADVMGQHEVYFSFQFDNDIKWGK